MRRLVLLPLTICTLAGVPAHAVPTTVNYNVDFSSPSQSFWGPGKSAASFGIDQFLLGNSTFGLRFETGASTGTVKSNYNSRITVAYDNEAQAGPVSLLLGFQGDSNGGHFDTSFGAFVDVTAYFPVIGGVTVTNPNYSLQTSRTYTPSPPDSVSDSDSFTPASTAIGPDIGVGSAQAGIDYDIVQNSTHTVSGLNGIVRATRRGNGEVRSAAFSLGATETLSLDLDLPGLWDVELSGLSLKNLFSTDFDLAAVPFVEYTLGFGCGDPGKDSDNGTFCGGDGRLDTTLASFDLFSNTPFALAMTSRNTLSSFQIDVAARSASVPEPASVSLLALGLLGLGVAMRRRKTL